MDNRFLSERGVQVFNGNELLVKGAYESGVHLLTGYPGSPVAEFFNACQSTRELAQEKGILVQIANNEALSAARLNGAQMGGLRAIAVMKSIGAHVASDALSMGNISKVRNRGGAVVVIGDDPWSESTQVPVDSRYLAEHLFIPVLEPSTFQEIKDWVSIAFELSEKTGLFIGFLITTPQADGGGTVRCHPNHDPEWNRHHKLTLDPLNVPYGEDVILPPRTSQREADFKLRFEEVKKLAREYGINKILYPPTLVLPLEGGGGQNESSPPLGGGKQNESPRNAGGGEEGGRGSGVRKKEIGFVTTGLCYSYLEHALHELGLSGEFPILKVGMVYPLDESLLRIFSEQVDSIFVIEEKRDFLEAEIRRCLFQWAAEEQSRQVSFVRAPSDQQSALTKEACSVWGKHFPGNLPGIPELLGLNPSIIMERLFPILKNLRDPAVVKGRRHLEEEWKRIQEVSSFEVTLPERTPTFCPGCPHRDSASILKEVNRNFRNPGYMKKFHNAESTDLIYHGDTGCYSMLFLEPHKELMHNYSGMGMGGGTGAGIDSFITNKQVVFMGDSTFFHSGMVAISDAIKNRQDITFVILENKTTAMTGHQPTPGVEVDILGRPTFAQNIERVVRGMSNESIPLIRMDPSYREEYRKVLEETILKEGVKVVIADKECGITFHRREKKKELEVIREKGFLPRESRINITPDVCEFCLECTKATGCPGLKIEKTHYGPKIVTDYSDCVSDSACTKLDVCPSFEEIIIERERAPEDRAIAFEGYPLTEPRQRKQFSSVWSAYMAGVGGMGVGVLTTVLVKAGMKEGYQVKFSDRRGLAIRHGAVYSQVLFSKNGELLSPVIPYGKADLLVGVDILEAARAIEPRSFHRVSHPDRTAAVLNSEFSWTVNSLVGIDSPEFPDLVKLIGLHTRKDRLFSFPVANVAERLLGNKRYTNLMVLGAAFQRGEIPLSESNLLHAIEDSVPPLEKEINLRAFRLGRMLVEHRPIFLRLLGNLGEEGFQELYEKRYAILKRRAWDGRRLAADYKEWISNEVMPLKLSEEDKRDLALRIYELLIYEDASYARRYLDRVLKVYHRDSAIHGFRATRLVIRHLFKVMAIKDEVYVAHLLTSPEKLERDRILYRINPEHGDRIRYLHLNRPEFTLFGRNIRFRMRTRNWQLRLIKEMKFLRLLLPAWHKREKAFRSWYEKAVDEFIFKEAKEYELYLKLLDLPEEVRGYREIRYPKMEQAVREGDRLHEEIRRKFPHPIPMAEVA